MRRNSASAVCEPVSVARPSGTGGSFSRPSTTPDPTSSSHIRYSARRSPDRISARTGSTELSTPSPPHSKSLSSSSDVALTITYPDDDQLDADSPTQ